MMALTCESSAEVSGEKLARRWNRRRADLSRCFSLSGQAKETSGGNDSTCVRLCLCGKRKVLQRFGAARSADGSGEVGGHHAARSGG